jgi:hypothetical protein
VSTPDEVAVPRAGEIGGAADIVVVGAGIVGARVTRELLTPTASGAPSVRSVSLIGRRADRVAALARSFGSSARVTTAAAHGPVAIDRKATTVVVTRAAGEQLDVAREQIAQGRHVVTTTDDPVEVEQLLALDDLARDAGVTLVVGAAMAPGMSCLLVRHAAELLDRVDEVHVSRHGAAGPGCARQRLRALRGTAVDWRDGEWVRRPGFSGRELSWFPDPIGARDCYRAALADPLLLVPALPGVGRVTARLAANRRDRALAPFPVLWPPPVEGGLGAVRVELRGDRGGARETVVYGVLDRPAIAAGATAAVAALVVAAGAEAPGATGLAGLAGTTPMLVELARRGVRAAVFEGAQATPLSVTPADPA